MTLEEAAEAEWRAIVSQATRNDQIVCHPIQQLPERRPCVRGVRTAALRALEHYRWTSQLENARCSTKDIKLPTLDIHLDQVDIRMRHGVVEAHKPHLDGLDPLRIARLWVRKRASPASPRVNEEGHLIRSVPNRALVDTHLREGAPQVRGLGGHRFKRVCNDCRIPGRDLS